MKVLISAYACEPGKGSEPGVGWSWANAIAKSHQVWVITRANNLPTIIEWEEKHGKSNIQWIGFDGPKWLCKLKKKVIKGDHLYYSWWQKAILNEVRDLYKKINFDLIHHVTFVTHQYPSYLYKVGPPLVFGPLAGADRIPDHLRGGLSLRDKILEKLRDKRLFSSTRKESIKQSINSSHVVIAANGENKNYLEKHFEISPIVHPAMVIEDTLELKKREIKDNSSGIKLLTAGRLIGLKGLWLAIPMLKHLPSDTTLEIIGEGPDEDSLKQLAETCDVSNRIVWHKTMKQNDLFEHMQKVDAFITPSLRDSGGMAALEALRCGCPVIAVALGGLKHSIQHEVNGYLVEPGPTEKIIEDLAYYCSKEKIKSLKTSEIINSVKPFGQEALSQWIDELYENIKTTNSINEK